MKMGIIYRIAYFPNTSSRLRSTKRLDMKSVVSTSGFYENQRPLVTPSNQTSWNLKNHQIFLSRQFFLDWSRDDYSLWNRLHEENFWLIILVFRCGSWFILTPTMGSPSYNVWNCVTMKRACKLLPFSIEIQTEIDIFKVFIGLKSLSWRQNIELALDNSALFCQSLPFL